MRYSITFLLLLQMVGCVRQPSLPDVDNLPKVVNSIAVLPSGVMIESGSPPLSPQAAKVMDEGVAVLDQMLAEFFSANHQVRLLSDEEVNAYSQSYSASPVAQALAIGKAMGAEAVMLWGLERYTDRSGGNYGVQHPSSVAFQYRLIHTGSGQTLCSASYDETQQSGASNLLALSTLAKRGFKWIPVSELLREGVIKKMAECKYLQISNDQGSNAPSLAEIPLDDAGSSVAEPPAEPLVANESITSIIPAETPPPVVIPAPSQEEGVALEVADAPDVRPAGEISQLLEAWRKAWEAAAGPQGDMEHFGAFYAADFRNSNQGRNVWLADKKKKNRSKDWIRVKITDISFAQIDGGPLWEARFIQEYASSNYADTSSKTLVFRKNGNNWEIVAERLSINRNRSPRAPKLQVTPEL
ncbi:MAG: hypothetical protein KKD63_00490 [Proteobacteria bacterium]|nr:hypothetical protein [Pseudomonadota bacterium]MDP2106602.1 hypothetical protein [Desulfobulbaceae bacterium]